MWLGLVDHLIVVLVDADAMGVDNFSLDSEYRRENEAMYLDHEINKVNRFFTEQADKQANNLLHSVDGYNLGFLLSNNRCKYGSDKSC